MPPSTATAPAIAGMGSVSVVRVAGLTAFSSDLWALIWLAKMAMPKPHSKIADNLALFIVAGRTFLSVIG